MTKDELAQWLHDNYEQLAKAENWQTQEITRVKFEELPSENKSTMLALAGGSVCDHYFSATKTGYKKCEFCGEPHNKFPQTDR